LIDSICKGIGEPYPRSFIKHGLVSAYIRVYGEITASGDEVQKRDFLRVLPTWTGVFPPEALKEIETKIGFKISPHPPQLPNVTETIKSSSHSEFSSATVKLLSDLQSVFENPPGPHISGIVGEIFKRLAIDNSLNRQTLIDLDAKAKLPDKKIIIETIKGLLRSRSSSSRSKTSTNTADSSRNSNSTNNLNIKNSTSADSSKNNEFNFELPPNFQIDLSLLNSIVELNKLNAGDLSASLNASPIKAKHVETDKHFVDIPLNSAELLVSRPKLYKLIYDDLPLHCKTCAIRFRDTESGRAKLKEHLDSHFRRNMRLKEKSKRVMTRDWFCTEEDWISAKQDTSSSSGTEKTATLFDEPSLETDNKETHAFVEASEEEQGQPIKCEVCQETIPLIWNDEMDLWVFPDCIRNGEDQIVHINCSSSSVDGKSSTKRLKQ
jgi:hypothetical protein